jgi:DNA ligase-1
MSTFKPLLAYTIEDTSKIEYPVYVSKKLDGIRAIVIDGVVYSRSMKPIRSKAVQELFGKPELNGLDGELLYGDWNAHNVFNLTTTAIMGTDLKDGFDKNRIQFAVFDYVLSDEPYSKRLDIVNQITGVVGNPQVIPLDQFVVNNEEELLSFETVTLNDGYEGIMARSIHGRYKQGRSTQKEGIQGKLKRFSDGEAEVIGFEERMHNTNEAKTNELGRTQRSQAQDGMVGTDTLGALICTYNGIQFTMGSGFDDAGRLEVWNNKEKYLGKLAKFKYFAIGMKDSYRFPIFLGWRDQDDL